MCDLRTLRSGERLVHLLSVTNSSNVLSIRIPDTDSMSSPRLVNSVEITENSVKFSNLKNSAKFSTESFSNSLKPLKSLKLLKFPNFHFDQ